MCVDLLLVVFFFFKQKTAYEMRISDWSSDVCSSDLFAPRAKRASSNSLSSWAATCCAGAAWCATWWKNCTPIRCGWRTRRQPCKRRSVRHERRSAVHERHVARPSHPDAAHSDEAADRRRARRPGRGGGDAESRSHPLGGSRSEEHTSELQS